MWSPQRVVSCRSTALAPSVLLTATLPAVALIVGGCAAPGDLTTSVVPTRQSGAVGDAPAQGVAQAAPNSPATGNAAITARQRAYLDDLAAAGVRRSTDLAALSIGSYICQGHAAGQPDQAVWDFVFPMVRGDLGHLEAHLGDREQNLSARDATTRYLRIATERLC